MKLKCFRIRCGGGKESNRRARQVVAFVGLLMAVFVTLALVISVRIWSVSAGVGNEGTHRTPVVVQLTESTLQDAGIHYGHPTSPPKISREQAIQIAKTRLGALANEATQINAQYVLFSNDNYYQDVPAWVVSFEGLNLASHGPPPITYNHELNVVVNAQTGEYMAEFSYR